MVELWQWGVVEVSKSPIEGIEISVRSLVLMNSYHRQDASSCLLTTDRAVRDPNELGTSI